MTRYLTVEEVRQREDRVPKEGKVDSAGVIWEEQILKRAELLWLCLWHSDSYLMREAAGDSIPVTVESARVMGEIADRE